MARNLIFKLNFNLVATLEGKSSKILVAEVNFVHFKTMKSSLIRFFALSQKIFNNLCKKIFFEAYVNFIQFFVCLFLVCKFCYYIEINEIWFLYVIYLIWISDYKKNRKLFSIKYPLVAVLIPFSLGVEEDKKIVFSFKSFLENLN